MTDVVDHHQNHTGGKTETMQIDNVARIILTDGTTIKGASQVQIIGRPTLTFAHRKMIDPDALMIFWATIGFLGIAATSIYVQTMTHIPLDEQPRICALVGIGLMLAGLVIGLRHRKLQQQRIQREDHRVRGIALKVPLASVSN